LKRVIARSVAVAGLLTLTVPASARTWHVAPDGSGDAPTVQAGIDSAQAGDDVLLAPGAYTWTSQGATGSSMIRMKPSVTLHSAAGRDVTVLDAEQRGRVIVCEGVGDSVRIKGVTIRSGFVQYPVGYPGGAAIFVSGQVFLFLADCAFFDNVVYGDSNAKGGGVLCAEASIKRCWFERNLVAGSVQDYTRSGGGAVSCTEATFEDCSFVANSAWVGGGGAVLSVGASFLTCRFNANGVPSGGTGGGITDSGPATITSCVFESNGVNAVESLAYGGAVWLGSGGGSVDQCVFVSNNAYAFGGPSSGGAIYSDGRLALQRSVFADNLGSRSGPSSPDVVGAVDCRGGGLIENCTLIGNRATPGEFGALSTGGIHTDGVVRATLIVNTVGSRACSGNGTWECCNLFGNTVGDNVCGTDAGTNFSLDPRFCAVDPLTSRNFTLRSDSPCAPGNHPPAASACGLIGAGAVQCGTTTTRKTTWSDVRKRFR